MPDVQVKVLLLNQTTNTLLAGTYGRSMWELFLDAQETTTTPVTAALVSLAGTNFWTGNVILAGNPLLNDVTIGADGTPNLPNGISVGALDIVGIISDQTAGSNPTLIKLGNGNVAFAGANIYGGVTLVEQGALIVESTTALGGVTNGTTVYNGAVLEVSSTLDAEPITLNGNGIAFDGHYSGALDNISGFNTYSGPLTLSTTNPIVSFNPETTASVGAASGSELTMTGVVSGGAAGYTFFKEGTGTVALDAANTYTGLTAVYQGALAARKQQRPGRERRRRPRRGADSASVPGGRAGPHGGVGPHPFRHRHLRHGGPAEHGRQQHLGRRHHLHVPPGLLASDVPLRRRRPRGQLRFHAHHHQQQSNDHPGDHRDVADRASRGGWPVGAGTVALASINSYSGGTEVQGGALDLQNPNGLGTRPTTNPGLPTINRITTTSPTGGGTFTLTFSNPLLGISQTTAPLPYNSTAAVVQAALTGLSNVGAGNATVAASVPVATIPLTAMGTAQAGPPTASGAGVLYTVTFTGALAQTNLVLTALGFSGTYAAVNTVATGGIDTLVDSGAELQLDSSVYVPSPTGFTVPATRTLALNGSGENGHGALHDVFGNNTWSGQIVLQSASSVGADPAISLTLSGVISGGVAAPLSVVDTGTVIFPGSSYTYTGGTYLVSGTAEVDGVLGSVFLKGGTLSGVGTVGTVTGLAGLGGTIDPGDNFAGEAAGTLTSNGGVTLDPSDQVFVDLIATPLNSDLLNVMNGSIDLNGATLLALADPTIPVGTDHFTIVQTDNATHAADVVDGVIPTVIPADLFAGPATAPVDGGVTATYVNINGVKYIADYFVNEVVITRALWNSTMTLSASITSPVVYGQAETILATMHPEAEAPTPTGTISFTIQGPSGTNTYTATLNAAGVATFDPVAQTGAPFSVGTYSVTSASYSALNFNTVTGTPSPFSITVNQAASTTSFVSSANPSSFGQQVTFTATVKSAVPVAQRAAGTLAPSGTVTFLDAGVTLGTALLNSSGSSATATYQISSLSVFGHTISVVYSGDANYLASNSATTTQTVNKAATTTGLTSLTNPSAFGQAVTFTATESSAYGAAIPSGETITFKDGASVIGTATLNGSDQAMFTTSSLSVAVHSITAVYGGDGSFVTSTSATLTQTVNKAGTMTGLSSSANPAGFGETVTFTATETSSTGAAIPSGETITFKDGASVLGTAALNSIDQAAFTISTLSVAGHSITAVYGGDGSFSTSTSSPALTETVNTARTTTTVSSSANPAGYAQQVTFTASVTSQYGLPIPNGETVTFLDGAATLGTATLTGGLATFETSSLAVTSHSITVSYPGDSNFASSTSTILSQAVTPAGTTTTVVSSENPSMYAQQVTFTATVSSSSSGAAIPNGETVTFLDGAATIGTATLTNGATTFATSALVVATHSITVSYAGDSDFSASTLAILSQTVNTASTATTLSSSVNPSSFGQMVTFSSTVSSPTGANAPNGETVTFQDNGTTIGTGILSSGKATFQIATLAVAGHSITAVYPGDANLLTSTSPTVTQTVNTASTVTTLSSSSNPSSFGQSVTLTATLQSSTGAVIPSGETVTFKDGASVIGTAALNGSDQALFTTSTLTVAGHSITAVYPGDGSFTTSTLAALTQSVGQATTTTGLTSSLNPSSFGQSVTFTVTETSSTLAAIPSGETITFKDGTSVLGTAALNGSDQATYTTATLAVAGHSITAVYPGDSNFSTNTSSILTQTVNPGITSTTLVSSTNPSVFGQSVTFTANVSSPAGAIPNGETVTFQDNGTTIGTGTLSGGQAVFTTSALSVAKHPITAVYPGDSNFQTDTSATVTQTVSQDTTATVVTASANPSTYGEAVTFTATVGVTGLGSGSPTGTVTFKDGASTLGTGLLSGGAATLLTTLQAPVAAHTITAVYSGDSNSLTSTSPNYTESVLATGSASSKTTITSLVNPSASGQPAFFTATVTAGNPANGTPTGTVVFKDLTTGLVLGYGVLSNGTATVTAPSLSVGSHSITALYSGDTTFAPGNHSVVPITQNVIAVGSRTSSTTAIASPSSPVFGQTVTLSATVTDTGSGGKKTPTGGVSFYDNGTTLLGVGVLSGTSGVATATLSISTLALGGHSITAVYGGDATFYFGNPSTAVTVTVSQVITTTTLTSSANPSSFGQSVTFTAGLSSSTGASIPSGETITFTDGGAVLGTATLTAGDKATFTTSTLAVAGHAIAAVYGGDVDFIASTSPTVTQTVNKATTTTGLVSSANPSSFGQTVTFTATETSTTGAAIPSGETITFKDGASVIGTAALNGKGQALFTTSTLALNGHSITAVYGGDGSFATSTLTVVSQTVNQAPTTTSVISSANPSVFGQSVTFTATVSSSTGAVIPNGETVTFLDGTTTLGTGLLGLSGGVTKASYTTSAFQLPSGAGQSITAVYGGDANFVSSASTPLTQNVSAEGSTTSVSSSMNPAVFGQTVIFTASVSGNGSGGTPTGTVTFLDGGSTLGTGVLGSGQAVFQTSSLALGGHSITAFYSGDSSFGTSTSAAVIQTVNQDTSTTTLTSSLNPSSFGQSVTFTATMSAGSPGSGTPTGTVTFEDQTTGATLGTGTLTSGVATLTTAGLSVGGHSIVAVYSGDTNFAAGSSTVLTENVNQEASSASVVLSTTASQTPLTFSATISPAIPTSGTPTGTVTFYVDGFMLATVNLINGQASYTVNGGLVQGNHTISMSYSGDSDFLASSTSMVVDFTPGGGRG